MVTTFLAQDLFFCYRIGVVNHPGSKYFEFIKLKKIFIELWEKLLVST